MKREYKFVDKIKRTRLGPLTKKKKKKRRKMRVTN